MRIPQRILVGCCFLISFSLSSCTKAYLRTLTGDPSQVYQRIFATDFNTAWLSVLDALKNSRIDINNREGGYLQTKWIDNTAEKNFSDSFGGVNAYQKAQYRIRITFAKSIYKQKAAIKISLLKEQLVQRDVLDGWHPIETDSVDEMTLLYRIGRLIQMRMKLAQYEDEIAKQELKNLNF